MKYGIIDYEVIGSGIPVLFIHGWGLNRIAMKGAFEPVFSEIDGYRRYYIDLPGMGDSEHGNVRNSDDILELLRRFASDVIKEKFIIVGQSYGGLLTRGFVNRFPGLIIKIILLCPCVIPGVRQGNVEPRTVAEKDDKLLASLKNDERDSFTLMNVVLTAEVWERYKKHLMPGLSCADWYFLDNVLEGSFSFDPDDLSDPCTIPCLIITGRQDSEVGYRDQFGLMRIYSESTYCVIDKAGHNLQIEQPELFEGIVKNWLLTH